MSPDAFALRDVLLTLLMPQNRDPLGTELGMAGLMRLARGWAAAFNKRHPEAAVDVTPLPEGEGRGEAGER